ncbi:MAG: alpha/beta hydrolase [Bacteroidia bacterium]
MNKLFYFVLMLSGVVVSCSDSPTKGEMGKVTNEVTVGEAGTITFKASDGLDITADYYPNEDATKIIILCHQAGFSRGEYKDIAPKLVDSGYACLAIDQRSGKVVNDIINETAQLAEEKGLSTKYIDAKQDILAAIGYVSANTDKEIILWGSSYSASLALIIGAVDERVTKVVAFSPGEFLDSQNTVRENIPGMRKPVFITGGSAEFGLVVDPILKVLPKQYVTYVKPVGDSDHGSKTLWINSINTTTTYEALFNFL